MNEEEALTFQKYHIYGRQMGYIQDLFPNVPAYPDYTAEGRILKHIEFKFPISYNAEEDEKWLINDTTVETVVLLSRKALV